MTLDQYRKLSQLIELQWYCQKSVLVPNTPEKPTSNNEQDSCTLVVPQSPESLIFTNITACFSNPKMKRPTFTKCYAFSFRPKPAPRKLLQQVPQPVRRPGRLTFQLLPTGDPEQQRL